MSHQVFQITSRFQDRFEIFEINFWENLGQFFSIPNKELLLMDQHAVAVTEEAVTFLDRFLVGLEQVGSPAEGGDEHHQGRIWDMEVGQHSVHQPEFIRRVDEDVSPSRMPLIIFQSQAFQNSDNRGPDSNDWFSFGFHLQKIV